VPAAVFDEYRAGTPVGRFGEPGDVAAAVAFLASAEAAFVNGVTIPVNGGSTID
jgi:NAD(P)-dependent dehydrogenase (short-subunit alcohol dehydrogenase family)